MTKARRRLPTGEPAFRRLGPALRLRLVFLIGELRMSQRECRHLPERPLCVACSLATLHGLG
jgi:hypothetical protein